MKEWQKFLNESHRLYCRKLARQQKQQEKALREATVAKAKGDKS